MLRDVLDTLFTAQLLDADKDEWGIVAHCDNSRSIGWHDPVKLDTFDCECFLPQLRRLLMKRKASKARSVEQIIRILRQADGGQAIAEICREHNIAEGTFYRWKKQYGGMDLAEAKRLKGLEKENAELKKMLAEAMLDNRVLKEINSKKW